MTRRGRERLRRDYRGVVFAKDKFILVCGVAPVMLVAHLDTVHAESVKDICKTDGGNILMSPQGIGGDDRCGVDALNKIYNLSAVKPHLLFTCDEEHHPALVLNGFAERTMKDACRPNSTR